MGWALAVAWWLGLVFLFALIFLLTAASIIGVLLPSVFLRASCSVADVKEPRYLVSFPVGYAAVLTYAALTGVFVYFLGRLDQDPDAPFGSMHVCGWLLALAVGWLAASLAYRLILAPSFLKGFSIAGVQLFLHALWTGLVLGVALTTLAVWQLLGFQLPWSNAPAKAAGPATAALVAGDRP